MVFAADFESMLQRTSAVTPSTDVPGALIRWSDPESLHWFAEPGDREILQQVLVAGVVNDDSGNLDDWLPDDLSVEWEGTLHSLCEGTNETAQQIRVGFWEYAFGLFLGEDGFWPFHPDRELGGPFPQYFEWRANVIDEDHLLDFLNYLRREFPYRGTAGP